MSDLDEFDRVGPLCRAISDEECQRYRMCMDGCPAWLTVFPRPLAPAHASHETTVLDPEGREVPVADTGDEKDEGSDEGVAGI